MIDQDNLYVALHGTQLDPAPPPPPSQPAPCAPPTLENGVTVAICFHMIYTGILSRACITSFVDKKLVPVGDGKHISTLVFNSALQLPGICPVVLVHGFGGASLFFFKNIDALSKDRVVITLDLPGFGRSSRKRKTSL